MTDSQLPPRRIVFVLDGVVQDIIQCQDKFAAVLLSEPTIIDATDLETLAVQPGFAYDAATNTFSPLGPRPVNG